MPISSLIVTTDPEETRSVSERLRGLERVTVADTHRESLVVLTDTETRAQDKSVWDLIEKTPGVKSLALVYHNFEDLEGGRDVR